MRFGKAVAGEGCHHLPQALAGFGRHTLYRLGASLDAHPLELAADRVAASGAITTVEAAGRIGRRVVVAGVRQSAHRGKTAKGDLMMFLTLEDLEGLLDVVLFPDVYRQARPALNTPAPLLVTGIMEMDTSRSEPLLRAEKVVPL